jgi:hypothetical protein
MCNGDGATTVQTHVWSVRGPLEKGRLNAGNSNILLIIVYCIILLYIVLYYINNNNIIIITSLNNINWLAL